MVFKRPFFVLLSAALALTALLPLQASAANYDHTFTVDEHGGIYAGAAGRHFRYHVPSGCSTYHHVIALHGGGMDENGGGTDIKVLANIEAYGDQYCVIVSYPLSPYSSSFHRQWNFSPSLQYGSTDDSETPVSTDDVGFVSAVAYFMAVHANGGSGYSIARAGIIGFSGGGFLALRMLCEDQTSYFYTIWALEGGMMADVPSLCASSIGLHTPWVRMVHGTGDALLISGITSYINGVNLLPAIDSGYTTSSTYGFLKSLRGLTDVHYYTASGTVDGYTSYRQYDTYDTGTYNENGHLLFYKLTGSCSSGGLDTGSCDESQPPTYDCEGAGCNYDTNGRPQTSIGHGGGHRWAHSPCGLAGADPGLPGGSSGSCSGDVAGIGVQSNAIHPSWNIVLDLVYGP